MSKICLKSKRILFPLPEIMHYNLFRGVLSLLDVPFQLDDKAIPALYSSILSGNASFRIMPHILSI